MALAAFKLVKSTGPSPATETDTSGIVCFLWDDQHTENPGVSPVPRPSLVTDPDVRSFEDWLKLELTAAPDNYVQDVMVWGDNTQPDTPINKLSILIGTTTSYPSGGPVKTVSTVATSATHNFHYNQSTGLTISTGQLTAIGHETNYLVRQLNVEFGAQVGLKPEYVFHWGYTEA